jgi:Protein of unknown function (DUF3429)
MVEVAHNTDEIIYASGLVRFPNHFDKPANGAFDVANSDTEQKSSKDQEAQISQCINAMSIPAAPLIGGMLGGLLFWVLALAASWGWLTSLALPAGMFKLLAQYAALIVSFTGAIWWGLALSQTAGSERNFLFTWSVVPCVLAWIVLALPTNLALIGCAGLLGLQLFMDYRFLMQPGLIARWVWRLRRMLTLMAVPALLYAAVNL